MTKQTLTPKKRKVSTNEWHAAYLTALRNSGNVRASCLAAGITRETAYTHRAADATFAAEWESAMEDAIEGLEAAARQRALASSDTLLIFLLKAHRPDKYRETINQHITGEIVTKAYQGMDPEAV